MMAPSVGRKISAAAYRREFQSSKQFDLSMILCSTVRSRADFLADDGAGVVEGGRRETSEWAVLPSGAHAISSSAPSPGHPSSTTPQVS